MMKFKTINPEDTSIAGFHSILLGAVGPRPIAFASTIDLEGRPNLSPFSFFNAFGANPPMLIFSPARRVRDNTTKHTLENCKVVPEVVINVVDFAMVQQMSLASTEYPSGVNEFDKAGFTMLASENIAPFRVQESPVQFECKVLQIIETGNQGGAGNLIICQVLKAHVRSELYDATNGIDQQAIDLVARMGGNWYCRAHGDALFEVAKPLTSMGIGIDQIPPAIRFSPILTGNHLGILGNVETLPDSQEIKQFMESEEFRVLRENALHTNQNMHHVASELLDNGKVLLAWKILLADLSNY